MSIESVEELRSTKARLGPLQFLDFSGQSLVVAHALLGESVCNQAQVILRRKLDNLESSSFAIAIDLNRHILNSFQFRLASPTIDVHVRAALTEYLACLRAWSVGAKLSLFQHPLLNAKQGQSHTSVTALDLALLLQKDNSGCQTGVYRANSEEIILWHTEEDVEDNPGDRFDSLRVAMFTVGTTVLGAFIYPDLLPGPAYSWRNDGFFQAVDGLYLSPYTGNDGLLANIAAWVTWRLGKLVPVKAIVTALAPFVDGYSITTVNCMRSSVEVSKVDFAGDQIVAIDLGIEPATYLFQVNVFSSKDLAPARLYEKISSELRCSFEARIRRTDRILHSCAWETANAESWLRLLSSRVGGNYAYATTDAKSYFLARATSQMIELWIGSGPAMRSDEPLKLVFPVATEVADK